MTRNADVDAYLAELDHPMASAASALRLQILDAVPGVTEHIKWNAPSFVVGGEDRVTFRIHPKGSLQLILHRGVQVRADTAEFVFDDPSGLIVWSTQDRGVITLATADDAASAELVPLLARWVLA